MPLTISENVFVNSAASNSFHVVYHTLDENYIVGTFYSEESAIESAKQCEKFIKIAETLGYTVSDKFFTNPYGQKIHIASTLNENANKKIFRLLLRYCDTFNKTIH